jgi:hypothetical protein
VRLVGAWLIERPRADLIAALGFESAPGFSAPLALALGERDRLLREHAATVYPDLPAAQQARLLAPLLLRYRATRWLRDRTAAACPYEAGDQHAVFWRVFRLADRTLSDRRLRSVLAI